MGNTLQHVDPRCVGATVFDEDLNQEARLWVVSFGEPGDEVRAILA
jgi:hypothetical protein